jgi:hypothetical protein
MAGKGRVKLSQVKEYANSGKISKGKRQQSKATLKGFVFFKGKIKAAGSSAIMFASDEQLLLLSPAKRLKLVYSSPEEKDLTQERQASSRLHCTL